MFQINKIKKIFGLRFAKMYNFNPLVDADRDSETQHEVRQDFNWITKRLKGCNQGVMLLPGIS